MPVTRDDVLDALSAVPMPAFLANFLQVSSQADNMLDMNYVPIIGAMVVTRRAWEKLPAETQEALKKSAEATGAEIRRSSREEDVAAVKTMREKHKLQVNELPPGGIEEWHAAMAKLYPKLRGEVIPADLFDEVESSLKEFRAKNSAAK